MKRLLFFLVCDCFSITQSIPREYSNPIKFIFFFPLNQFRMNVKAKKKEIFFLKRNRYGFRNNKIKK